MTETDTLRRSMIARWQSAERPLFKGKLIDHDGCCCAQGDVLRVCGASDDDLWRMRQREADRAVATKLGISMAHAILLRKQNDGHDGCPQDVLDFEGGGIQRVLGPHAHLVLAFWRHLDAMSPAAWTAAGTAAKAAAWTAAGAAAEPAAWAAAGAAARAAAEAAAWTTAGAAAEPAAWTAAGAAAEAAVLAAAWTAAGAAAEAAAWTAAGAAAGAAWELQGWSHLPSTPFFLPIFGITDPDAWVAAIDPTFVRGSALPKKDTND